LRLSAFGLLTDENIHPVVVAELRAMGFDVYDVCENGLFGRDDIALLQLAQSQGRVVVTHDSDFGTLTVARLEPFVGIIYLRPGHIDPQFTKESLRLVVAQDLELVPPFIVVAKRTANSVTIRVRNLPAF
jgi:predicted nuclease of predicted toxin-antitoxin system